MTRGWRGGSTGFDPTSDPSAATAIGSSNLDRTLMRVFRPTGGSPGEAGTAETARLGHEERLAAGDPPPGAPRLPAGTRGRAGRESRATGSGRESKGDATRMTGGSRSAMALSA